MKRSGKILIVCHCILNANAKVYPLAAAGGVFMDAVSGYIEAGCGLLQLPCPETSYLGMNRWGMTKEQYDVPNFRAHCRKILEAPRTEILAFVRAGYEITGVFGMDGSPNCGVSLTCEGYHGGEVCRPDSVARQVAALRFVSGKGVFMEELTTMLEKDGLRPPLFAVREDTPDPSERSATDETV